MRGFLCSKSLDMNHHTLAVDVGQLQQPCLGPAHAGPIQLTAAYWGNICAARLVGAASSKKSPGREIRSSHCLSWKSFFQAPWMSYYFASQFTERKIDHPTPSINSTVLSSPAKFRQCQEILHSLDLIFDEQSPANQSDPLILKPIFKNIVGALYRF